jgi:hypothetical protein
LNYVKDKYNALTSKSTSTTSIKTDSGELEKELAAAFAEPPAAAAAAGAKTLGQPI